MMHILNTLICLNMHDDVCIFSYMYIVCMIIRPKQNYVGFPVTRPTLIFDPDPKVFIKIFLFVIRSCIMLFVCQTRLGSLGVLYEL